MKSINKFLFFTIFIISFSNAAFSARNEIDIPDIGEYKTLKCDFHIHTVFSDGLVWPTVRVDEAWNEGLDCIAISDHIEYTPFKADIPKNLGRSYKVVENTAKTKNIINILSAEITKEPPARHFNALFLSNVDALDKKDVNEAIMAANEQKGFVFWNHPESKKHKTGGRFCFEIHEKLAEEKLIHGVEICNGYNGAFYEAAYEWATEKGLTLLGNSDMHQPDITVVNTHDDHRTMTLVFAKDKTVGSFKEALFKGRTAVWYKDKLIGKEEYLSAIFDKSVTVSKIHYKYENTAWAEIRNSSVVTYVLKRTGTEGPAELLLPANQTVLLQTKVNEKGTAKLNYEVINLITAPGEKLQVVLNILK